MRLLNVKWLLLTNVIPVGIVFWMYQSNTIVVASLLTSARSIFWLKMVLTAVMLWAIHATGTFLLFLSTRKTTVYTIIKSALSYVAFFLIYVLIDWEILAVRLSFITSVMYTIVLFAVIELTKIQKMFSTYKLTKSLNI